jgi:hypothetical protein
MRVYNDGEDVSLHFFITIIGEEVLVHLGLLFGVQVHVFVDALGGQSQHGLHGEEALYDDSSDRYLLLA